MARPRRTPRTAFGAWLGQWLDDHPEYTQKALGADIAEAMGREKPITAGAISQWLSGDTLRIGIVTLRGLASVTGEPVANLERMVYPKGPAAEAPAISADVLDAIEERMRRAFREELQAALRQLGLNGPPASGSG